MAKESGWIKLHRTSFNNELYFSEPFTRWQAWCDLLLLANHQDGWIRVRGIRYIVKRGQTGYSMPELAKRWKWSIGKVKRFLNELQIDGQIALQKNNITTLISIVNYHRYQDNSSAEDSANDTANSSAESSQIDAQTEPNNNDNNDNKNKELIREGEIAEKKFLVPEMFEIFKKSRPIYPEFVENDYKPILKIARFLATTLHLKGDLSLNRTVIALEWQKICEVIPQVNKGWYKEKSLSVIANQIQEIHQYYKNGRNSTTSVGKTIVFDKP